MNNRGSILIYVVWLIFSIETVLLSSFALINYYGLKYQRVLDKTDTISIIENTKSLIIKNLDEQVITNASLRDSWNNGIEFIGAYADLMPPFWRTIKVNIKDEERKLDINVASMESITKLIMRFPVIDAMSFVNNIKQYRQNIIPIYDLSEITAGLSDETKELIYAFFTIYSNGKINVNTVSREVFDSLPGVTVLDTQKLISYRNGPDRLPGTPDDLIILNTTDLLAFVQLDQKAYNSNQNIFVTDSSLYRIDISLVTKRSANAISIVYDRTHKITKSYWRHK